jgi:hypothetical protein
MSKRVLIIGGYGNFGSFIARRLSREPDITIVIAGRSGIKAGKLAEDLKTEWATIDIAHDFDASLEKIKPDIVIHTSGPFQGQGYDVAEACIRHKCHYIDLADGREFVADISGLNAAAQDAGVLVVSGASSVPALTSAIIDEYAGEFKELRKITYGIATAQKTTRGLATTKAILGYAGKPFKTLIDGEMKNVHGWHDLTFRKFMGLGYRPLGNCDIPDLEIFPRRYPDLKTIRFHAGLELKILHLGLWSLSWLARLRLSPSLQGAAPALLRISRLFDPFGKDDSGFYMHFSGKDAANENKEMTFNLVARHGDGLYIPGMPAVIMARKIARNEIAGKGAFPCVGFIALNEYLSALSEFDIKWLVD